MNFIPYGRQSIDDRDIESVIEALKSDWLTQGPTIGEFEKEFASLAKSPHAIACSNATAALTVAVKALGAKAGDLVWTSPNSFNASANCALYNGCEIDFVDIDPQSLNLCPNKLEEKLVWAEKNNRLPKIVIPVHFSGRPCEMERIWKLAKHFGFSVIEDASHAVGGSYKNEPIGECQWSDLCVFSFHPVKIITTGEGGMITTKNSELAQKCRSYISHGITKDPAFFKETPDGPWYSEQQDLGWNFRITDFQAALGISQIKKLPVFIKRRRQIVHTYLQQLSSLPLILPEYCDGSSWHLFVIQLQGANVSQKRKELFHHLVESRIGANVHYRPIHLHPFYKHLGFKLGDFPNAESYYNCCLTLPLYPSLSWQEQDHVIKTIEHFFLKKH